MSWDLLWESQADTKIYSVSQCPKDSHRGLAPTPTFSGKEEADHKARWVVLCKVHLKQKNSDVKTQLKALRPFSIGTNLGEVITDGKVGFGWRVLNAFIGRTAV